MMRPGLTIALVVFAGPAMADGLVGMTVPPYPGGLTSLIGSCVGDADAGEDICAWSIAAVGPDGGEAVGIYAARAAGHEADGSALWAVTAELPLPRIEAGYDLIIGECRRDGAPDATIAAVARQRDDGDYSDDVTWAAKLDRGTGALAVIDSAAVDCLFPGT